MLKRTLSSVLATVVLGIVVVPGFAQKATTSKSNIETEVVGSVNGKPLFTLGQLVTRFQKDNPTGFESMLSNVVGKKVAKSLFSGKPAPNVMVSRAEILQTLRKDSPLDLVQFLDTMLSIEAVTQEAKKLGANPSDAQLDEYISYLLENARKQGGIPAGVTDEQFLAQRNLTRAKLKENLRPQVMAINLGIREIEKRLKHPFGEGDVVEARHILIKADPLKPDAKPEDKQKDADALAKIKQIRDDIVTNKKTFEVAAKESSDDPGSKENGGSLGAFMPDGTMVEEFQKAAFSTVKGDVTEPFRTQFGYHILQVTKTGKDMTAAERKGFLYERAQRQVAVVIRELTTRAKIVNKLQPKASGLQGMPQIPN